jgi:hypothetical protein
MESGVVVLVTEDEAGALVVIRNPDEDPDDHEDAQDVPTDGDVVEEGKKPVGEDVDARVEDEDEQEQHERVMEAGGRVGGGEVDSADLESIEGKEGV